MLCLDCHVHIYPNFDLTALLDAAVTNFQGWKGNPSPSAGVHGALLLTLTAKDRSYEQIVESALRGQVGHWQTSSTSPEIGLELHKNGHHLILIPGWQVATADGLEVHALGCQRQFKDGLATAKTVEEINASGALAAIPWGAGKWLGARAKLLTQLIQTPELDFLLSDSGLRPRLWPRPRLFDLAQQHGRGVIAGTDPLPLACEATRVGSFGITLDTDGVSLDRPESLLAHLHNTQGSRSLVGHGRALLPFLRDQIRIRTQKMTTPKDNLRTSLISDKNRTVRETPDIETASDDYASRFTGAAGGYFLQRQAQTLLRALANDHFKTILEVGGGHAQLASVLETLDTPLTQFGSDSSCEAQYRKRWPATTATFITGNVTALPFADRAFDAVVSVRLLPHIEAWPELIAELCRVANRAVILDYPSLRSLNALTPLLFGMKKGIEKNTRTYLSFTTKQLDQEFARHGFKRVQVIPQFLLPMVLHRASKGARPLQWIEALCSGLGITRLFGSPIILRAERMT